MMKNTLLFQVWESLSAVEVRRLEKFLHSPYHNKHEGVLRLYEFLKKHGQEPEEALSRERVYAFVHPDSTFDDLKLRHVMSYLLKAMEMFLVLENPDLGMEGDFLLLDTYRKRKLESPFQTKWNAIYKQATAGGQHGQDYHQAMLRLQTAGLRGQTSTDPGELLSQLSEELDAWFLIRKLRAGAAMLRHKKRTKQNVSNGLLDPIIITAKIMGLLKPVEIAVHYYAYQILNEPDDLGHFANFKDALASADGVVGMEEIRELLDLGIEFCMDKVDSGYDKFLTEAFKLYARGAQNGAFLDQGKIAPEMVTSILSCAMQVGEMDWASEWLEKWKDQISGADGRSHYLANQSRILASRKDYKGVKALLDSVFIPFVPARLEAEVFLMQALYELGEKEALDKLIGSFLRGLHRKETPSDRKKAYRNFGKRLRKILKNPTDKDKLQDVQGDLAIESDGLLRDWLLDVLEKLI
jgi:hypothetical protein